MEKSSREGNSGLAAAFAKIVNSGAFTAEESDTLLGVLQAAKEKLTK